MTLENIFTERVVYLLNSLPSLVVEAPLFNRFKRQLDKFCSSGYVLYDFKAPSREPEVEIINSVMASFIVLYTTTWR